MGARPLRTTFATQEGARVMSFYLVRESLKPVPKGLPTYAAVDLTKGAGQAQIVLGDQTYTLRITRAGKLILTK